MAILGQRGGDTGLPNIMFAATDTWTPDSNVEAMVYCIGGGGSGAIANEDVDYSASGGGAGGTAVSKYTFLASTAYTITIGAGGASHKTTAAAASAGNAGNASTIAVGGSTFMTGGAGGAGAIGSGASCSGGTGGSGSGGNIANHTGGAGGACDATKKASGGGAVGLWADGNAGQAGLPFVSSRLNVSYGGAINNYEQVGTAENPDHGTTDAYLYGANLAIPISMSPFPEIISYQDDVFAPAGYEGNGYADQYPHQNNHQVYTPGRIFNGGNHREESMASDYWYLAEPTGPFEGGKGVACGGTTMQNNYGSRVSCGAGSGACTTNASSAICQAARGGDGVVLIFPISMG